MEKLLENLGHNERLIRRTLDAFRASYPRQLEAMRLAVSREDAPELARVAHMLKGTVGYFGLPDLTEAVLALEDHGNHGRCQEASPVLERLTVILTSLDGEVERVLAELSGGA